MKPKITHYLLFFYMHLSNIYPLFETKNKWFYFGETILPVYKKITPFDFLINFLKKNSGSIDFILFNIENLEKSIRPSPLATALSNLNFTIYNRIIF